MSAALSIVRRIPRARRRERGAALAIGLLLLPVATLLAVAAMATATLELRMAANADYRERAFQAAEFAIEQAINSPDLRTAYTSASPKIVPATGSPLGVPGSTADTYSYRLYYDPTPAGSATPPESASAGLEAYHFVIEASGRSARGAQDLHVQAFYVLHPIGWSGTTSAGCEASTTECVDAPGSRPQRTYWRQQDAE